MLGVCEAELLLTPCFVKGGRSSLKSVDRITHAPASSIFHPHQPCSLAHFSFQNRPIWFMGAYRSKGLNGRQFAWAGPRKYRSHRLLPSWRKDLEAACSLRCIGSEPETHLVLGFRLEVNSRDKMIMTDTAGFHSVLLEIVGIVNIMYGGMSD